MRDGKGCRLRTGRLGCCMATSGGGAIHLLNGLYDAKPGRVARHVAQVMKMASEHGSDGDHSGLPEGPYNHARPQPGAALRARRLATVGAYLAVLAASATPVGLCARRR